jgi:hypothetical protein
MFRVFIDETGEFRPCAVGSCELAAVFAVILPELDSDPLQKDFSSFLAKLPQSAFVNGEPKGRCLSLDQHMTLAKMLNAHRGIMTAPVTFNRQIDSPAFDSWPQELRELLEEDARECIHLEMRQHVEKLAKRCGNLNSQQISRLMAYKIAVERALHGICLFYHCAKYHSSYSPIEIVFDRTGTPNNREELVFKDMIFFWVNKNGFSTVKQIHNDDHPFVKLYGARVGGQRAFDMAKMIRGNLQFADSKDMWQLQVADMLASAWINCVRDRRNDRGYLPVFRVLHRNTTLPKDQPLSLMSVADYSEEKFAAVEFNVYRHLVAKEGKFLPCSWD